jgi:hypothetical protein
MYGIVIARSLCIGVDSFLRYLALESCELIANGLTGFVGVHDDTSPLTIIVVEDVPISAPEESVYETATVAK